MDGQRNAAYELGVLLKRSEAKGVADRIAAGLTLTQALVHVRHDKASKVRPLIEALRGTDAGWRERVVFLLRAIEGARQDEIVVSPIWTAPDMLVSSGSLNSARDELVRSARTSVICSTYNFQQSSSLWNTLAEVSRRPEVMVKLYVDTDVADTEPESWRPTTEQIARALPGVMVYRTKKRGIGKPAARNHAKFIAIDHRRVLVTSANFSASAETSNIELGLHVTDPALVQSIERQMASFEEVLYERING